MWKRLRHALWLHWQRSQRGPGERRAAKARARFWTEVREGQREAEARSRPRGDDSKRFVSDLSAAKIEEQGGTENPSHEHQVAAAKRVLSISDRLAGSGLLAWRCSDAG